MRTSLLLFILILFFIHPIAQMHWYSEIGNISYMAVDPLTWNEINNNNSTHNNSSQNNSTYNNNTHNNTGDIYRDGIIDNYDNFKNFGYPLEYWKVCFSKLVGPCSKDKTSM